MNQTISTVSTSSTVPTISTVSANPANPATVGKAARPMLAVEGLSCGYGDRTVVQDLSLTLTEGESLCLLGPNGCGKTTFLRALAGILSYRGRIRLDGVLLDERPRRPARSDSKRATMFALLSQTGNANFPYTVYETVLMGRFAYRKAGLFSSPSAEDRAAALACLDRVGLAGQRDTLITRLSGGQLQRVFVARAFAQDPRIILLDEPANHLDLKYRLELIGELKEWTARPGKAAIGVFHDLDLALAFADRALVMEQGRAVCLAPADDLDPALLGRVYGVDLAAWRASCLARWGDR